MYYNRLVPEILQKQYLSFLEKIQLLWYASTNWAVNASCLWCSLFFPRKKTKQNKHLKSSSLPNVQGWVLTLSQSINKLSFVNRKIKRTFIFLCATKLDVLWWVCETLMNHVSENKIYVFKNWNDKLRSHTQSPSVIWMMYLTKTPSSHQLWAPQCPLCKNCRCHFLRWH